MHGFSSSEVIVYSTVWLVGALASFFRTLNDSDYRDYWRVLGAVGCGGFLAVSAVGILGSHFPGSFGSGGYSIGVASLIGLLGKSTDYWTRALGGMVLRMKLPEEVK